MAADVAEVDLQPLFPDPILEQVAFPPSYTDHTNHVWRVRTAREEAIVRLARPRGLRAGAFWWGCSDLFGLDPERPGLVVAANAQLGELSPVPVPRVLRVGVAGGRPCLVVTRLPGERLLSFDDLPLAAAAELGTAIARIHSRRFTWWGAPDGTPRRPLAAFHAHLSATLRGLVQQFHAQDAALAGALYGVCARASQLPPPEDAALVMLDIDPTQFLTDRTRLTGLVDTDAFAVAPRALDLVGYEYELGRTHAAAFARAYRTLLPLPDLRQVRPVYRYLLRLLEVQGAVPLDIWRGWPSAFDRAEE